MEVIQRCLDLNMEGATMTGKEAMRFLRINRDKWAEYIQAGLIKPHYLPDSKRPVFKRIEIEQILIDTEWPDDLESLKGKKPKRQSPRTAANTGRPHPGILKRKLTENPDAAVLLDMIHRQAQIPAERANMTAKEAMSYLGIDRPRWDCYHKQGVVTAYYRPLTSRAVYRRVELEGLLTPEPPS